MSLSLQEAKEQIAKENGYKSWKELNNKESHAVCNYGELQACKLVLSSKSTKISSGFIIFYLTACRMKYKTEPALTYLVYSLKQSYSKDCSLISVFCFLRPLFSLF